MSELPSPSSCASCGALIDAGRTDELCPACLMGGVFKADDSLGAIVADSDSDIEVPSAERSCSGIDSMDGSIIAGRYKILQRIGEGGFGTVYMAEQAEPVRRRVALKILKAGMDTRQVVARFEAERQALALMDHPNIAKVFDGGEAENGRPFFVMELVRGTPITQFCQRENFTTKERLELFILVCRAVQHAHLKGIIHRDLKPSNILVTTPDGAEPVPKVIDFGVAKAIDTQLTDKTLFTRFEQMLGTPAYMSPEQAGVDAHDIDTRADVYALGGVLYELLTGTTPFEAKTLQKAAFEEIRRMLREDEPPKPSTRLTEVRQRESTTAATTPRIASNSIAKDLDWIVMMALEKDRRRRYDTANGLAEDVGRFLADEAVSAGPPSKSYRLGKFLHRHRSKIAAASLVLVALVAGLAVAAIGFAQASNERNRAVESEAAATQEAAVSKAVSEFLTKDLLEKASPKESPNRNVKLRTVLEAAAENVGGRFADQPQIEAELRATLAKTYSAIGLKNEAADHVKRAVELFESSLGPDHRKTLEMSSLQAGILGNIKNLKSVIALQRKHLGPEHPDTLRSRLDLGRLFYNRNADDSRKPVAELCEELIPILDRVFGPVHEDTLLARMLLQLARFDLDQRAGAEEDLREIIELQTEAFGSDHPATLRSLGHLGVFLLRTGRLEEAEKLLRNTLETSRSAFGFENQTTQSLIVNLVAVLAEVKPLGADQMSEILSLTRENLDYHESTFGIGDSATLKQIERLGAMEMETSSAPEQALGLAARAVDSNRREYGPGSKEYLQATTCMARVLYDAERPHEAGDLVAKALMDSSVRWDEIPWGVMEELTCCCTAYGAWDSVWQVREKLRSTYSKDGGAAIVLRNLAMIALFRADLESFGELREELIERFGKTDNPEIAQKVAFLLITAPVEDLTLLEKIDFAPSDLRNIGVKTANVLNAEFRSLVFAVRSGDDARVREMLSIRGFAADALGILVEHPKIASQQALNVERRRSYWLDQGSSGVISGNPFNWLFNSVTAALWQEAEIKITDDPSVPNRLIAAVADSKVPAQAVHLVDGEATWKYHYHSSANDPVGNSPDFFRSFFLPEYDDGQWGVVQDSKGRNGGFGYGDPVGVEWDPPEVGIRSSAYLRHKFETDQDFDELWLRCRFDDGIIVYLDGEEIGRINVIGEQGGELSCWASDGGSRRAEVFPHTIKLRRAIKPGRHLLAISLHNISAGSSDLSIGEITLFGKAGAATD